MYPTTKFIPNASPRHRASMRNNIVMIAVHQFLWRGKSESHVHHVTILLKYYTCTTNASVSIVGPLYLQSFEWMLSIQMTVDRCRLALAKWNKYNQKIMYMVLCSQTTPLLQWGWGVVQPRETIHYILIVIGRTHHRPHKTWNNDMESNTRQASARTDSPPKVNTQ